MHQNAVPNATLARVQAAGPEPAPADAIRFNAYQAQGGYRLLRERLSVQRSADSLMQALDDAGLRGLGGAGFSAGRKWRIVRGQSAPRLMAVNIDEGEPGTFKDRWYLERDPHRFLVRPAPDSSLAASPAPASPSIKAGHGVAEKICSNNSVKSR